MEPGAYSKADFRRALHSLIPDKTVPPCLCPQKHPEAVLLGGQSGAGKTALHQLYQSKLNSNAIVINGDEYRALHPQYYELNERYGSEALRYTDSWAHNLTEALINQLSQMRYNLIIEGTLRTSTVPLQTARLLHSRGYNVSLAIMAVKPEISLISCRIRYELMRTAGSVPRATDSAFHDAIVPVLVENLGTLEDSGLFDSICLYSRNKELLYPQSHENRTAAQVLEAVLFGPWTAQEEEHYTFLQSKLATLSHQENS